MKPLRLSILLTFAALIITACNLAATGSTSTDVTIVTATPQLNTAPDSTGADSTASQGDGECVPRADWQVYVVEDGDTLGSISLEADISIDELAAGNCLTDPDNIFSGQEILVPVAIEPVSG